VLNEMSVDTVTAKLQRLLTMPVIDVAAISALLNAGSLPVNAFAERALAWRVLLHYLPPNRDEWGATLTMKRDLWRVYCNEHPLADAAATHTTGATQATRATASTSSATSTSSEAAESRSAATTSTISNDGDTSTLLALDLPSPPSDSSTLIEPRERAHEPDAPHHAVDVLGAGEDRSGSLVAAEGASNTPFGDSAIAPHANTDADDDDEPQSATSSTSGGAVEMRLERFLSAIDCDVARTNVEDFFHDADGVATAHAATARRVLYVYCALNSGVGYVQGMNEIVAHLYRTFALDPTPALREHAAAVSALRVAHYRPCVCVCVSRV
jgi:hypothetical protein